jgi:hypothetical protein
LFASEAEDEESELNKEQSFIGVAGAIISVIGIIQVLSSILFIAFVPEQIPRTHPSIAKLHPVKMSVKHVI